VEWIYHLYHNPQPVDIQGHGRCPYNHSGLCTIYDHRFAGCRIFQCDKDMDTQAMIYETTLAKFKQLCIAYNIPYRYVDLFDALNGVLSDIGP
jgi:Fe-S-cluster containining protein